MDIGLSETEILLAMVALVLVIWKFGGPLPYDVKVWLTTGIMVFFMTLALVAGNNEEKESEEGND